MEEKYIIYKIYTDRLAETNGIQYDLTTAADIVLELNHNAEEGVKYKLIRVVTQAEIKNN